MSLNIILKLSTSLIPSQQAFLQGGNKESPYQEFWKMSGFSFQALHESQTSKHSDVKAQQWIKICWELLFFQELQKSLWQDRSQALTACLSQAGENQGIISRPGKMTSDSCYSSSSLGRDPTSFIQDQHVGPYQQKIITTGTLYLIEGTTFLLETILQ